MKPALKWIACSWTEGRRITECGLYCILKLPRRGYPRIFIYDAYRCSGKSDTEERIGEELPTYDLAKQCCKQHWEAKA